MNDQSRKLRQIARELEERHLPLAASKVNEIARDIDWMTPPDAEDEREETRIARQLAEQKNRRTQRDG